MSKILVLCTGNSCRSQMAEGFLRSQGADVVSAGTESHGLNPTAVEVMAEAGVDIASHQSKTFDQFLNTEFSHVVTVCDDANENCPAFPGPAIRIHKSFQDPAKATDDEKIKVFRAVRDEIKLWSEEFMSSLNVHK